MILEDINKVGYGTKLEVKEDCKSARGFGENVIELKKGQIIECVEAEETKYHGNEVIFRAITEEEKELVIFYDQVEIAEERYSTENLKKIKNEKQIYIGMSLITKEPNCKLGIGKKVKVLDIKNRYITGLEILVESGLEKQLYDNEVWFKASELGIPEEEKTKNQIVQNLIDHLEKSEELIYKDKALEILKALI